MGSGDTGGLEQRGLGTKGSGNRGGLESKGSGDRRVWGQRDLGVSEESGDRGIRGQRGLGTEVSRDRESGRQRGVWG